MGERIDLRDIERRAWTSYFQDGLWGVFFGIMAMTSGIRSLSGNPLFTLGIFLGVMVFVLGKRYITVPRLGNVKFGPQRIVRKVKMMGVLLLSFLVIFTLLFLPELGLNIPGSVISPILAAWIAVVFGVLAYYMDFKRLFLYGLLFAGTELVWGILGEPAGPVSGLVAGILMLSVGLIHMSRFVRKYPKGT